MLKVLGLKVPKRKATKDKLINLIISLFHIKLNYNDTSNLLLYPYVYVLVESSQMCVSSQSIPLNSAGSSEIVTEGNYILDFVARSSYLLDRQVSSCFSCPNLPYLYETCPIKVWSIFGGYYVSYSIALLFPDKSLVYLIHYLRVYTLAHSCLIKV